ncbi:hypothetical protein P7K49_007977 [Saguinus oedipus]|uniref:Uncharacterized protein n=1 Tax=Saguinus oedipus TaxID=9490 RepID=A0ABQ9VWD7_SAGOE|nr:hypothetical protein P7K49_007977 [Saguinus oedipus]
MGIISFLMLLEDSGAEKENTSVLQQNPSLSGSRNGEENIIDNPYLRPVKKPKIRRKKRPTQHSFDPESAGIRSLEQIRRCEGERHVRAAPILRSAFDDSSLKRAALYS